MLATDLCLD